MIKHKEIERRVDTLEQAVNEIKEAVKTIAENSTVLARLEAHHEETRESLKRAFESIATNRKDYEMSGEKECRIRANGPTPGKNPKKVGDMLAVKASRFPCRTNSPPEN